MRIATHSGKFHADDVWAVAVLSFLFPDAELIRTRDAARIAACDFAVDVGGEWNAQTGRFDHHQKGFSGARLSGVTYASAGLVWREYGARCVALLAERELGEALEPEQARQIAYAIDSDVVQYLDMADTGAARNAPGGVTAAMRSPQKPRTSTSGTGGGRKPPAGRAWASVMMVSVHSVAGYVTSRHPRSARGCSSAAEAGRGRGTAPSSA